MLGILTYREYVPVPALRPPSLTAARYENAVSAKLKTLTLWCVAGALARAVTAGLGACRAWGVASEKRPQRGQFLPDLQAHSSTMGQKVGEKWTAEAVSQPTIPKSDRLLDHQQAAVQQQ